LTCPQLREPVFLAEMELTGPRTALFALIAPHAPAASTDGPRCAQNPAALRVRCLHQWYGLSDVAMGEALFDGRCAASSPAAAA
jgi:IS5 family transposase